MKLYSSLSFSILFVLLVLCTYSCQNTSQPIITEPAEDIKAIENGLKKPMAFKGEEGTTFNILDRMKATNVAGVSIAVIQDGKMAWARGYGYANTETKDTIDAETVFQAGSISKPVAALAALKLVDEGKIDLDENVNTYLKGWKIPDNEFTTTEKVTLRRLLTHTAGLTVHGFPGYNHEESIPSVIEVLDGQGNTDSIRVDTEPGSIWRYSGGGYTIMQKLVEDVSGDDFAAYVQKEILTPLGMGRSTYVQPLPESFHTNASAAFDGQEGVMAEGLWNNYPEKAAAGLWTTPSDLVKYCVDIQRAIKGGESQVLSTKMIERMLSKDKNDWGLGPSLEHEKDSMTFGHGGKNRGFSNLMTAFVHKGEGAIVMTNTDSGTRLMREIMAGISAHYGWDWFDQKVVEKIEVQAEQLKEFEGKFVLVFGDEEYPLELEAKEDHIEVFDIPENQHHKFFPVAESEFIFPDRGSKIKFNKNEEGAVVSLDYHDGRSTYTFEKK